MKGERILVTAWIDELTPCLRNSLTGETVNTEVVRIKRQSFLAKFNKKNGWYINWASILKLNPDAEIYALVLEGTMDIQGLVAIEKSEPQEAVYIIWMCSAPHNNKLLCETPKYYGVGGHLFAIAIDCSLRYGYGGSITGHAANLDLMSHYADVFNAEHIGITHPYQFAIWEKNALKLKEVYRYEWSDEEL